jgi:hypothetical protein
MADRRHPKTRDRRATDARLSTRKAASWSSKRHQISANLNMNRLSGFRGRRDSHHANSTLLNTNHSLNG